MILKKKTKKTYITDLHLIVCCVLRIAYDVLQAEQWLPTITKAKSLRPFKIELQEEHKTEIRCRKIRISNKGVSNGMIIQICITVMHVHQLFKSFKSLLSKLCLFFS